MSRPQSKYVRVNPNYPEGAGQCERCGHWYNLRDLVWQYSWGGTRLYNTRVLVCTTGNRCYDIPNDQLRSLVLPPDPPSLLNARVPDFDYDNQTVILTQFAPGSDIYSANPAWGAGPAMIMCDQTGETPLVIQYLTQSSPEPAPQPNG
jgi:hypothetical protein